MWCYTKKNGTVLYRERYQDPLTGKNKIMSVSKQKDTPQNRNKAQRELNAKIDAAIAELQLSLIHISEPTRRTPISYAVFCLKKKKQNSKRNKKTT